MCETSCKINSVLLVHSELSPVKSLKDVKQAFWWEFSYSVNFLHVYYYPDFHDIKPQSFIILGGILCLCYQVDSRQRHATKDPSLTQTREVAVQSRELNPEATRVPQPISDDINRPHLWAVAI